MNVICIAGNITKTPELRSTQGGKQVTSFTVAVNESKDKAEFINCVAWEKTAELIAQYCPKGSRISLSGRLQTRKHENDKGETKYYTEVIVNQFDFPPKGEKTEPKQEEFDDEIPGDF